MATAVHLRPCRKTDDYLSSAVNWRLEKASRDSRVSAEAVLKV